MAHLSITLVISIPVAYLDSVLVLRSSKIAVEANRTAEGKNEIRWKITLAVAGVTPRAGVNLDTVMMSRRWILSTECCQRDSGGPRRFCEPDLLITKVCKAELVGVDEVVASHGAAIPHRRARVSVLLIRKLPCSMVQQPVVAKLVQVYQRLLNIAISVHAHSTTNSGETNCCKPCTGKDDHSVNCITPASVTGKLAVNVQVGPPGISRIWTATELDDRPSNAHFAS
mmetsp:Transcript_9573/g.17149  ORF Transcript_9573/g.17149 Transcript_9573/m.17149 type:complete len:227 (+) Transcript_9573:1810-2490(+)